MTPVVRRSLLALALAVSLIANLVLWNGRSRGAAPGPRAAAPVWGVPRLTPAAPAQAPTATEETTTCTEVIAARSRELDRLQRSLARQAPYSAQYEKASPNPAAKRWFDERVAPRLAATRVPLAADCRGDICRLELTAPSGNLAPHHRLLAEALAPFDYQRVEGAQVVPALYVRIAEDPGADGRKILSDFEVRYSWEGLREVCQREGPLTGILRVSIRIVRDGNDEPVFAVTLGGSRGYGLPATTPAQTCLLWTLHKALERVQLTPSVTRATLEHPFAAP
jgi:hypothetical protein